MNLNTYYIYVNMSWLEKVIGRSETFGQTIVTPFTTINSCSKITVLCVCGELKTYQVKDYLIRNCRTCSNKLLKSTVSVEEVPLPPLLEGEKWVPTVGGMVSNKSRACNNRGKLLQLDEKYRWHLAGKLQYASIILANAFQIKNYERLQDSHYVVRFHDKNSSNLYLDNLYIGTRNQVGIENGKKCFKEVAEVSLNDVNYFLENVEHCVIKEFPNYLIFASGLIFSVKSENPITGRFLIFSKSITSYKSYFHFTSKDKKSIYVHKLICMAFHPVEGKTFYDDYEDLQVNHKDGNTLNNRQDNLEWVSKSQNMQHAYDTGLNKKVQGVKQYQKCNVGGKGEFIKEHISIAAASRETKVPEHEIRAVAQGKSKGKNEFFWEFSDPEKAKVWSVKFSHN
jgi:hypothetical protein